MNVVLALDSDALGHGDDELGQTLIVNFLRTLAFRDDVPQTIVCYNYGVKLAETGSLALPALEALVQRGAEVLLCGTCVNYLNLQARLAVGEVSDMRTIVERLLAADKVLYV
ncbi:MAG: sulfurtransferase-like selenium metabolism protein YedF [Bacteroidetes bacterium]|nr:sulfurtransferase-like selenium metabolism protein YedF [Bacteroidota bacterium]MCL5025712.1 sulfurtransferase-like selenium metabolism protein YedF [Chloroflexota bacterium]